jgi:hypothetical protein
VRPAAAPCPASPFSAASHSRKRLFTTARFQQRIDQIAAHLDIVGVQRQHAAMAVDRRIHMPPVLQQARRDSPVPAGDPGQDVRLRAALFPPASNSPAARWQRPSSAAASASSGAAAQARCSRASAVPLASPCSRRSTLAQSRSAWACCGSTRKESRIAIIRSFKCDRRGAGTWPHAKAFGTRVDRSESRVGLSVQ